MAVLKCKMCGGDLVLNEESTVARCEYCGTQQTVPTADNEKKLTLFQRANRLRLACEFDKAAEIYEAIVGTSCVLGLKSDGTVVSAGMTEDTEVETEGWKLFDSVDSAFEMRKKLNEDYSKYLESKKQANKENLLREKADLINKMDNLKGVFATSNRRKFEHRLQEIDQELARLSQ